MTHATWEERFDKEFTATGQPFTLTMVERIQDFITTEMAKRDATGPILSALEKELELPVPFSADKTNPLKHCYQNEGYIAGLERALSLVEGVDNTLANQDSVL